jgi:hypothetical protein
MKTTPTLLFTLLIAISSCKNPVKDAESGNYYQDFDNLKMYYRNAQVTSEQARSGDYSAYTGPGNEFSLTFEMDYPYAKKTGYKSIDVEGWIFAEAKESMGGLVVSVEGPGKPSAYHKTDLQNVISNAREWTKITATLDLPENAVDGSIIKVYLWSPSQSKIFLDDLDVKFNK